MPDRERIRLQQFIAGIWITMTYTGLQAPDINICVEVGAGALILVELCVVPEGRIMWKRVPPEKTKDVLEFATKKPHDRLASITSGLMVLAYGQSQYMREYRMHVDDTVGPINLPARVLLPPRLRYGQGSPQPVVTPANGAWNMVDKRFFRLVTIDRWIWLSMNSTQDMINGLVQCCRNVSMRVSDTNPMVTWQNGQGHIVDQLCQAGNECFQRTQQRPMLIVVILLDNANDIYMAVKHFGDVTMSTGNSCGLFVRQLIWLGWCSHPVHEKLKVLLGESAILCECVPECRINVKLGGINTIPDPQSVSILMDPRNPMIVMGTDVIHPAPGSEGRPSFTALVGNSATSSRFTT
ncbi:hypothetical protein EDC04DRAFT_3024633 [Pisolithus marmoratus]|nr:hypothetical protein EDC04DRAFT_3024633 [Pisolithus marmoratus]